MRVGRVSAATPALFRALEHVGGALSTRNLDDGINALTRSAGTLSILNVPRNLGPGSIRGYRKLSTVAGDLLIAKELTTHRPASGQHLLDQLVGFTDRVILL